MSQDNSLVTATTTAVGAPLKPVYADNSMGADYEAAGQDLQRFLQKHAITIAASILTTAALTLAYCLIASPLYTARTTIEIKGYAPILADASIESMYGTDTRKAEYQKTTIAKLKRPGIADRVLSKEGVLERINGYFQDGKRGFISELFAMQVDNDLPEINREAHYRNSPGIINSYLGLIDVNPVLDTSLVEIEATTRDALLSQQIANMHAEGFIEDLKGDRHSSMTDNLDILEKQAEDLRVKPSAAEDDLAKYAKDNRLLVTSEKEGDILSTKSILGLSQSLAEAQAKRIKAESLLEEIRSAGSTDATTLDDETIKPLRVELGKALAERRSLATSVTSEFPLMKQLDGKIASLKSSISAQRKDLFNGLRIEVSSLKATEESLLRQLELEKDKGHEDSRLLVNYGVKRKGVESLRELYESILKQAQETKISASTGAGNIIISDYATLPVEPSFPKIKPLMILGVFAGLTIGILVAVAREVLNNKINSKEDLERTVKLPVFGAIPHFVSSIKDSVITRRTKRVGMLRKAINEDESVFPGDAPDGMADTPSKLIASASPYAVVAEALRTVRAGILLSAVDGPTQVLMITSASQGEGKSSLAANLAVSLAQAENKVLLIDGDLRQPTIAGFFNLHQDRKGLVELLSGNALPEDAIYESSIAGLSVLTSGTRPPNPAELLGSNRMGQFMARLREQYDFVVIDTPPVMAVADSLMLSKFVDRVILVARYQNTLKKALHEASKRLIRVNAKLAGVILNDYSDPALMKRNNRYYVYPTSSASNS